jgi:Na+/H+-translocating membrane pyrophosphatase
MVPEEIACLDESPSVSRVAARQEFLNRWYRPVAIAPFIVVLVVVTAFFPNSHRTIQFGLGAAAMVWAGVVIGYAIYLRFSVRCPVCGWRFVSADLKGSQFGRFRWEPVRLPAAAGHTNASTAV